MGWKHASFEERLWRHIDKGGTCWTWTGSRSEGYGRIRGARRSPLLAHRAVYELLVGPIPVGLQLDHICRNRACVNPAHLEVVTLIENARRSPICPIGVNSLKTNCVRGHELAGENLYLTPDGRRQCRKCKRAHRTVS